ncbi:toll-like receptor 11 [Elgaria multicarinata webbii]|uniref:toll-like receptor 11 n=1 Tax=Elgaria multicarinata webbii TaxID=159646 RepID=UPI002FCD3279
MERQRAPDTGIVAFCSNVTSLSRDLSTVPDQVKALCIEGDIKVLSEQVFLPFPDLHYLSITLKTPVISPGAFLGLNKLQYLSIHHLDTGFTNISFPAQAFLHLHQLQTLDLKGIHLTGQRGIMLPDPLKVLSISSCCLGDFSELFSIFPGLRSVPQVSLNNCEMGRFPDTLSLNQHPNRSTLVVPVSQSQEEQMNLHNQNSSTLESLMLSHFPLAVSELLVSEIEKLELLSLEKTIPMHETYQVCALASRFSLRSLMFSQNNYKSLDSEELPGCYSVENLVLEENNMEQVDSLILYKLPHLQLLDLSGNHLHWDLCPLVYEKMNFTSRLRILDFSGNRFNSLEPGAFSCLPFLETLSLNDCGFKNIPLSAFSGLSQLKVFNLGNNQLQYLPKTSFYNLSSLISLGLYGNPIEVFGRDTFQDLALLKELQVGSYNVLPDIWFSVPNVTIFGLESNLVTFFKTIVTTAFASVQNMSLSGCYNFEKAWDRSLFPSVQMLHWDPALHCCNSSQPLARHFPQLEQLIYKYDFRRGLFSGQNFNMSHLSKLRILEVHNLPEDHLYAPPEAQYFYMDLPHLEALRMVNSNIRYISAQFFKGKSRLKLLVLEKEGFLTLDSDIQDQIPDEMPLRYMHFSSVTFRCDCSSAWLIDWATRKKGIYISGLEQADCLDVQTREKKYKFVPFIEQNCSQDAGLILFIVTSSFLFLLISLPILNATCGLEFLFLVYILRAWCHGVLNHKRGRRFQYDAFVSYSSHDQEWVLQHLVPNLEQMGAPFLKLCLHNRDFVVGWAIVDNIMESLYNSHKTICVVSRNALSSSWCSLEMSLATYRLMVEKEDTLILLFLEHVPKYQLSAYHRLAKLVKRKAYLNWPKEPAAQPAFWNSLKNSLKQHCGGKADDDEHP